MWPKANRNRWACPGEAKRFISESVADDKPFMAYICTNAPHGPFHCPDEYWKPYQDKVNSDNEAIFYGMIANIDENVGQMRAWLEEKGLAENTLFIFMTDNGTATGDKLFSGGMRGKKGSEYEGGHRVPFFMHWPDGGLTGGRDIDQLTAHIDVLPTLIELCGLKPLVDYKVDGVSLVPLLEGSDAAWPERTIVTDSQRVRDPIKWRKSATMTQRWRLINGVELYDIQADPLQEQDVADKFPEVLAKLRADYDAWWDDISPVFKKDARIIIGNPAENPSRLTCHDWLTFDGSTPWNQGSIRRGQKGLGEWALKVEAAGDYRIRLRRWPASVSKAISEDLAAGSAVQGLKAQRETPGKGLPAKTAGIKIGGNEAEKPVHASDEEVVFDVTLDKGEVNLLGYFVLEDGSKIGSYYAYVERL